MTPPENLRWLFANCLTVTLNFNDHRSYHETVAAHFEHAPERYRDPIASKACIEADQLVELQVYPSTPVGFHHLYGPKLDPLVDEMVTRVQLERGPRRR